MRYSTNPNFKDKDVHCTVNLSIDNPEDIRFGFWKQQADYCKMAHAQASRKRITDGTRKTLGVSSPCLLDCL
jgi:hypothetical protein